MSKPYAYTSTHKNSQFYYPINRWVDIIKYPGKVKPTRGQLIIILIALLALIFVAWFQLLPLLPPYIKQFLIDHLAVIILNTFVLYAICNQE